ncbi:hypothetical protein DCO58_01300 [Helicobacter saguini]|uniref:Beta-lactamase n=1 Tax=Helicobacter saguini TaxID=1548018 RepID=A0A347VRA1_9HELI|nr:sel1 repeat family protein [Helicobacter saguini]MWV62980.1 hypothetical protein [Helicobacter saguini]MWV66351.1 hypothetical protein [Helicobacter saguini]MWV68703.1 hypothetical protein [Helicobacter saguini]MWV71746.1 hypothetical protein [Helicobacter saguini]TLD91612.1 sel1 repeat family protein [Helicobacter saguini]
MKWLYSSVNSIFYSIFLCSVSVFVGCATFEKFGEFSNKESQDYSGIVQLHKEMNDKKGKTSSYFASIAVANEDYDKAYGLYYIECKMGSVVACLNAYYIGEERALSAYDSAAFARDLDKSIKQSISACSDNESMGCANVFFAFDALNDDDDFITDVVSTSLKGQNNDKIMDKALYLTQEECDKNDATSCFLYARMSRSIDNYADVDSYINKGLDSGYVLAPFVHLPVQSPQTIDYFQRACTLNEALSCNYVAYWFDKYERDTKRAREFYKKACTLGVDSACLENKIESNKPKTDELGAPVLNRR